jgi:hypothetical protein
MNSATTPAANRQSRLVQLGQDETSRLFSMALSRYFQQLCRLYRHMADGDIDLAIVASAASLAAMEGAWRDPAFRREFANLDNIVGDRQRGCNALSIAEATGLPRETVRRKMNKLVEAGFLVRRSPGDYIMQPGLIQTAPYRQLLGDAAAETLRFVNDCLEQGVFAVEAPARR